MKFTKTLAISLLALGAMQFAMAEEFKVDLTKKATKSNLTLPATGKYAIGDVISLKYNQCVACNPENPTLEVPEDYMTILPTMIAGGSKAVTTVLQITAQPKSDAKPLVVHANGKDFSIKFNVKEPTIIDLTKQKEQEVSINKAFKIGDAIKLIFVDVQELVTFPPVAKTIDIHIPNYLTQIKDESLDMPKGWTGSKAQMRHLTLKVTAASDEKQPITIGYKEEKEPQYIIRITAR